jgi:hypothetical protein
MVNEGMGWERRIPENEILQIEDYLSRLMSPVQPRDEFVRDLRQGLGQAETTSTHKGDFGFLEKLFWVGAGFASAVVCLTVGIRVIIKLVRGSNLRGRGQRSRITPLY